MRRLAVFRTVVVLCVGACSRGPARDTSATAEAWPVPAESSVADPRLLAEIRRGRAILHDTPDSLPQFTGNALRCVNCHLDDGTRRGVLPWIGVYARFPQYRPRSGRVDMIEDRVNGCLRRSMNGRALPLDSHEMRSIVSYLAFLSRGISGSGSLPGIGLAATNAMAGDSIAGRGAYAARCARCHGADGQGVVPAPPLWGERSYNVGAGMARRNTAAAFILAAMPFDSVGTISERTAADIATFIDSRPRPDFAGKELDWPNGDPPPDVAYPTLGVTRRRSANQNPK